MTITLTETLVHFEAPPSLNRKSVKESCGYFHTGTVMLGITVGFVISKDIGTLNSIAECIGNTNIYVSADYI